MNKKPIDLNKIILKDKHIEWLKNVSRTFFLSIKFLPKKFRGIVGYSYILCRFLDIIEDNEDMDLKTKQDTLEIIKDIIDGEKKYEDYIDYFNNIEKEFDFNDSEIKLLHNSKIIFLFFDDFQDPLKIMIRKWVGDMAYGMNLYAFENNTELNRLDKLKDLDLYTYYVAGTVGGLLTDIYSIDIKNFKLNRDKIIPLAINFGKGLQLVNIVKDSRADFKENRCYIPNELFLNYDSDISKFFKVDGSYLEENQEIYHYLINNAEEYLYDAVKFIKFIPWRHVRLRFACWLPLLLANETLNSLKDNLHSFIRSDISFKISRKKVKISILKSIWKSIIY